MNKAQAQKIILVNLAFWFIAMLLHPPDPYAPDGILESTEDL